MNQALNAKLEAIRIALTAEDTANKALSEIEEALTKEGISINTEEFEEFGAAVTSLIGDETVSSETRNIVAAAWQRLSGQTPSAT